MAEEDVAVVLALVEVAEDLVMVVVLDTTQVATHVPTVEEVIVLTPVPMLRRMGPASASSVAMIIRVMNVRHALVVAALVQLDFAEVVVDLVDEGGVAEEDSAVCLLYSATQWHRLQEDLVEVAVGLDPLSTTIRLQQRASRGNNTEYANLEQLADLDMMRERERCRTNQLAHRNRVSDRHSHVHRPRPLKHRYS